MFTNRIKKHLKNSRRPRRQPVPPHAPPVVPPGFVVLPGTMFGPPGPGYASAQQLYQMAYEAAQAEAREKLLRRLRARLN
jgi:hypothetical protein